jgi:methylglutaconyl-CoA hydratase
LLTAPNKVWLDDAISAALEATIQVRQTEDFHEGVAAFLEKRKPIWKKTLS